jgi:hypothetical protein
MVPATLTPLLVQARTRGRIRNLKLVHSGGSDLGTNLYYVISGRCIQQLHHVDSAGRFSNWRPAIGEWLFVDTAVVIFIDKSTGRSKQHNSGPSGTLWGHDCDAWKREDDRQMISMPTKS